MFFMPLCSGALFDLVGFLAGAYFIANRSFARFLMLPIPAPCSLPDYLSGLSGVL